MPVASLLSKLKLSYQDSDEEKEYRFLRFQLSKTLFGWLFFFVALVFIPLTIRYFTKHLEPQCYLGVGFIVVAILILLFRRKLERYLEYISIIYISLMLGIYIANMRIILEKQTPNEAFYLGYSFALVGRMLDFRIVDFKKIVVFTIISVFLKLYLVKVPNVPQIFLAVCLEIFPLLMNFVVEKADRVLFDSLHKSKHQLLKFKQVLTEQLPNQMAIFSQDFKEKHFVNNSFQRSFHHESMNAIKGSLDNFTIDEEDVENNKEILGLLSYELLKSKITITFSDFLERVSQNLDILHASEVMTVQVSGLTLKDNSFTKKTEEKLTTAVLATDTAEIMRKSSLKNQDSARLTLRENLQINSDECADHHSLIIREKSSMSKIYTLSSRTNNLETMKKVEKQQSENPTSDDYERRTFKVKIFPLIWNEQEAIALIFDDITHEKTIMELTKIADKNKDLVIAMISHELRTPLNGMLGLMEIVRKKIINYVSPQESDVFSYIEACKSSSFLLLNLVNSILDFSQIKNSKLKLNPTEFSIADALSEVKSLFTHFCIVKNLYLAIEIDPTTPSMIFSDRTRLCQILINLIGNAFKFTFQGGVKIKVQKINQDRLQFSIEDTGIGIKPEDQEKLFKMFGRLEQIDKRVNTNGVGLGLTISNTLALLLNPESERGIEISSEVGQGSVFSFDIVISTDSKAEIDSETESCREIKSSDPKQMDEYYGLAQSKASRISGYNNGLRASQRITKLSYPTHSTPETSLKVKVSQENQRTCLLVDDNPFNLMVATNLLEERNFTVKTAMNGKEAVETTEDHQKRGMSFDLILMDCQMPIMDGYQASKILRKMMTEGEIKECPIIALTANNRDETHEKLWKESGMSGHIAKPLQMQEFESTLKQVHKEKNKLTPSPSHRQSSPKKVENE